MYLPLLRQKPLKFVSSLAPTVSLLAAGTNNTYSVPRQASFYLNLSIFYGGGAGGVDTEY